MSSWAAIQFKTRVEGISSGVVATAIPGIANAGAAVAMKQIARMNNRSVR